MSPRQRGPAAHADQTTTSHPDTRNTKGRRQKFTKSEKRSIAGATRHSNAAIRINKMAVRFRRVKRQIVFLVKQKYDDVKSANMQRAGDGKTPHKSRPIRVRDIQWINRGISFLLAKHHSRAGLLLDVLGLLDPIQSFLVQRQDPQYKSGTYSALEPATLSCTPAEKDSGHYDPFAEGDRTEEDVFDVPTYAELENWLGDALKKLGPIQPIVRLSPYNAIQFNILELAAEVAGIGKHVFAGLPRLEALERAHDIISTNTHVYTGKFAYLNTSQHGRVALARRMADIAKTKLNKKSLYNPLRELTVFDPEEEERVIQTRRAAFNALRQETSDWLEERRDRLVALASHEQMEKTKRRARAAESSATKSKMGKRESSPPPARRSGHKPGAHPSQKHRMMVTATSFSTIHPHSLWVCKTTPPGLARFDITESSFAFVAGLATTQLVASMNTWLIQHVGDTLTACVLGPLIEESAKALPYVGLLIGATEDAAIYRASNPQERSFSFLHTAFHLIVNPHTVRLISGHFGQHWSWKACIATSSLIHMAVNTALTLAHSDNFQAPPSEDELCANPPPPSPVPPARRRHRGSYDSPVPPRPVRTWNQEPPSHPRGRPGTSSDDDEEECASTHVDTSFSRDDDYDDAPAECYRGTVTQPVRLGSRFMLFNSTRTPPPPLDDTLPYVGRGPSFSSKSQSINWFIQTSSPTSSDSSGSSPLSAVPPIHAHPALLGVEHDPTTRTNPEVSDTGSVMAEGEQLEHLAELRDLPRTVVEFQEERRIHKKLLKFKDRVHQGYYRLEERAGKDRALIHRIEQAAKKIPTSQHSFHDKAASVSKWMAARAEARALIDTHPLPGDPPRLRTLPLLGEIVDDVTAEPASSEAGSAATQPRPLEHQYLSQNWFHDETSEMLPRWIRAKEEDKTEKESDGDSSQSSLLSDSWSPVQQPARFMLTSNQICFASLCASATAYCVAKASKWIRFFVERKIDEHARANTADFGAFIRLNDEARNRAPLQFEADLRERDNIAMVHNAFEGRALFLTQGPHGANRPALIVVASRTTDGVFHTCSNPSSPLQLVLFCANSILADRELLIYSFDTFFRLKSEEGIELANISSRRANAQDLIATGTLHKLNSSRFDSVSVSIQLGHINNAPFRAVNSDHPAQIVAHSLATNQSCSSNLNPTSMMAYDTNTLLVILQNIRNDLNWAAATRTSTDTTLNSTNQRIPATLSLSALGIAASDPRLATSLFFITQQFQFTAKPLCMLLLIQGIQETSYILYTAGLLSACLSKMLPYTAHFWSSLDTLSRRFRASTPKNTLFCLVNSSNTAQNPSTTKTTSSAAPDSTSEPASPSTPSRPSSSTNHTPWSWTRRCHTVSQQKTPGPFSVLVTLSKQFFYQSCTRLMNACFPANGSSRKSQFSNDPPTSSSSLNPGPWQLGTTHPSKPTTTVSSSTSSKSSSDTLRTTTETTMKSPATSSASFEDKMPASTKRSARPSKKDSAAASHGRPRSTPSSTSQRPQDAHSSARGKPRQKCAKNSNPSA